MKPRTSVKLMIATVLTLNTTDNIYNSLSTTEKAALTLQTTANGSGYSGVINLGVQVG
jgi:hypothetical protein